MSEQTYSISALARLSGVSVRTLHHYDRIGLLVPRRSDNGYRQYDAADLQRLQQILLWRACGMELRQIGAYLHDPDFDERQALQSQLALLQRERRQLDEAISNVKRTLAGLTTGENMSDQQRFEGLKRRAIERNEQAYGHEARQRHGNESVERANAALLALDEEEWNDMQALEEDIKGLLSAAMASGDPTGPDAQALVAAHARWLQLHWGAGAYSPASHRGLAAGYLADERFVAYYDQACGTGATQFLHDAICALI